MGSFQWLLAGCAGAALLAGSPALATIYSPAGGMTQTVSTVITSGTVNVIGAGSLELTGTNSYAGGTTVSSGTLVISQDNNLGAITSSVTLNGGTLAAHNADIFLSSSRSMILGAGGGTLGSVGFGGFGVFGAISGTGNLTVTGDNDLYGVNSYTGQTIVASGLFELNTGSSIASSSALVTSPGTLTNFDHGTYTVQEITGHGIIQLSRGSALTVGTAQSFTFDGAFLSNDVTESVIKSGTGTMTLTGGQLLSGKMTIAQGTVLLTAFSSISSASELDLVAGGTLDMTAGNQTIQAIAGSGGTILLGANTLTVGSASSTVYDGIITGTGGFTKTASGTQILNGINSYTGLTTISAGLLEIGDADHASASIAGAAAVMAGGQLGGHGTIGGDLTNAGTVSPGGSVGTLTVGGNYTQTSSALLSIAVTPQAASKLAVSGSAQIDGTLNLNFSSGQYVVPVYRIVTANNGITGTFSTVNSNMAGFDFDLVYNPDEIDLEVASTGFLPFAQTGNQRALASMLDRSSIMSPLLAVSGALATAKSIPQGLDQLTGEGARGISQAGIGFGTQVTNAIGQATSGATPGSASDALADASGLRRFQLASADPETAAADDPASASSGLSAWMQAFGAFGSQAGDGNGHGLSSTLGGGAFGIDHDYGDGILAGVAIGYGHTDYNVRGLPQSGSADQYALSLYGRYLTGPSYLSGSIGYGRVDADEKRTLAALDGSTAKGSTGGNQLIAAAEYGYRMEMDDVTALTPFLSLQISHLSLDGFTESGSSLGNLVISPQDTDSVRSTIGAHGSRIDVIEEYRVTTQATLGWAREFADIDRSVTAAFLLAPSAGSFTTEAARTPRDAMIIGLGSAVALDRESQVYLRYTGDLASGNTTHAITAGFSMSW